MASSISTSISLIPKRSLVYLARHHADIAATATHSWRILASSASTVLASLVTTTTPRPAAAAGDDGTSTVVPRLDKYYSYARRVRSAIVVTLVVVYVAVPIGVVFGCFRSSEWVSLTKSHPGLQTSLTAMTLAAIAVSTHYRRHRLLSPLIVLAWLTILKYMADKGALPNHHHPLWFHQQQPIAGNASSLLTGKVCVVTGGNTGIGLATAELLARHGAHVIITCRTVARCQPALQHLRQFSTAAAHRLELDSLQSAYQLTQELTTNYSAIHYLFNNAGSTPVYNLTVDGFEDGFGGMHLAHFAVTLGLLPLLRRAGETTPARIIFVSSEMAVTSAVGFLGADPLGVDFDKGDGEGDLRGEVTRADGTAIHDLQAYGRAKLCNVMTALELNRRLAAEHSNVTVHALHPGAVLTRSAQQAVTEMFRIRWFPGLATLVNRFYLPWSWRTPEQAAHALLFAALATYPESLATGGQYLDAMCRPFLPSNSTVMSNPTVVRRQIGKQTITFYKDPVEALRVADEKWSKRLWDVSLSLLRNSPARDLVDFAP